MRSFTLLSVMLKVLVNSKVTDISWPTFTLPSIYTADTLTLINLSSLHSNAHEQKQYISVHAWMKHHILMG